MVGKVPVQEKFFSIDLVIKFDLKKGGILGKNEYDRGFVWDYRKNLPEFSGCSLVP